MDITLRISPNGRTCARSNVTTGSPSHVSSSVSFSNGTMTSVITSKSTDLTVTATHCVYETTARNWYNNNNWVFVPAYSNNVRPYGTWPARSFSLKQAWISSADYNYDVAFVALSTLYQRHIQSVVVSQGIGFNQPCSAYVYSFGYPSNLDSGLYLKSCVEYTQASKYTQNRYLGQGLSCNMGHRCSGEPWLQYVVDATGIGYVTSVNSFLITAVPNVLNGPYFETNIKSLYDYASTI